MPDKIYLVDNKPYAVSDENKEVFFDNHPFAILQDEIISAAGKKKEVVEKDASAAAKNTASKSAKPSLASQDNIWGKSHNVDILGVEKMKKSKTITDLDIIAEEKRKKLKDYTEINNPIAVKKGLFTKKDVKWWETDSNITAEDVASNISKTINPEESKIDFKVDPTGPSGLSIISTRTGERLNLDLNQPDIKGVVNGFTFKNGRYIPNKEARENQQAYKQTGISRTDALDMYREPGILGQIWDMGKILLKEGWGFNSEKDEANYHADLKQRIVSNSLTDDEKVNFIRTAAAGVKNQVFIAVDKEVKENRIFKELGFKTVSENEDFLNDFIDKNYGFISKTGFSDGTIKEYVKEGLSAYVSKTNKNFLEETINFYKGQSFEDNLNIFKKIGSGSLSPEDKNIYNSVNNVEALQASLYKLKSDPKFNINNPETANKVVNLNLQIQKAKKVSSVLSAEASSDNRILVDITSNKVVNVKPALIDLNNESSKDITTQVGLYTKMYKGTTRGNLAKIFVDVNQQKAFNNKKGDEKRTVLFPKQLAASVDHSLLTQGYKIGRDQEGNTIAYDIPVNVLAGLSGIRLFSDEGTYDIFDYTNNKKGVKLDAQLDEYTRRSSDLAAKSTAVDKLYLLNQSPTVEVPNMFQVALDGLGKGIFGEEYESKRDKGQNMKDVLSEVNIKLNKSTEEELVPSFGEDVVGMTFEMVPTIGKILVVSALTEGVGGFVLGARAITAFNALSRGTTYEKILWHAGNVIKEEFVMQGAGLEVGSGTGFGVSGAFLPKVFKPFANSWARNNMTNLGYHMVKGGAQMEVAGVTEHTWRVLAHDEKYNKFINETYGDLDDVAKRITKNSLSFGALGIHRAFAKDFFSSSDKITSTIAKLDTKRIDLEQRIIQAETDGATKEGVAKLKEELKNTETAYQAVNKINFDIWYSKDLKTPEGLQTAIDADHKVFFEKYKAEYGEDVAVEVRSLGKGESSRFEEPKLDKNGTVLVPAKLIINHDSAFKNGIYNKGVIAHEISHYTDYLAIKRAGEKYAKTEILNEDGTSRNPTPQEVLSYKDNFAANKNQKIVDILKVNFPTIFNKAIYNVDGKSTSLLEGVTAKYAKLDKDGKIINKAEINNEIVKRVIEEFTRGQNLENPANSRSALEKIKKSYKDLMSKGDNIDFQIKDANQLLNLLTDYASSFKNSKPSYRLSEKLANIDLSEFKQTDTKGNEITDPVKLAEIKKEQNAIVDAVGDFQKTSESKSFEDRRDDLDNKLNDDGDYDAYDRDMAKLDAEEVSAKKTFIDKKVPEKDETLPVDILDIEGEAQVKKADATIKEHKGTVASKKVQEIYNEKGADGAFDIIKLFKPMTLKIAETRAKAPGYAKNKDLLIDEIETGVGGILDLIKDYNPENARYTYSSSGNAIQELTITFNKKGKATINGIKEPSLDSSSREAIEKFITEKYGKIETRKQQPVAAFVNNFLGRRAITASRRILDKEFTKELTDDSGSTNYDIAEDFQYDTTLDDIRGEDVRQSNLIDPINLMPNELATEYREVVKQKINSMSTEEFGKLTFAKLNDLAPEVTAKFFKTTLRKVTDTKANLATPEIPVIQKIIYDNRIKLIKLLPEGAILEGTAASESLIGTGLSIPRKLQQAFYNQNIRLGKGAGLIPFELKKNITQEDFLKTFGINRDGTFERFGGQDPRSQSILAMIRLQGKIASNTAVRMEAEQTMQQAVDLKAGTSKSQLSMTIKDANDIIEHASPEMLEKFGIRFGKDIEDRSSYLSNIDKKFGENGIPPVDHFFTTKTNSASGKVEIDARKLIEYLESRAGLARILPEILTIDKGMTGGFLGMHSRTDGTGMPYKVGGEKILVSDGKEVSQETYNTVNKLLSTPVRNATFNDRSVSIVEPREKVLVENIQSLIEATPKGGKHSMINSTKTTNAYRDINLSEAGTEAAFNNLKQFNPINKKKAELFINVLDRWANEKGLTEGARLARYNTVGVMFTANAHIIAGFRGVSSIDGIVRDAENVNTVDKVLGGLIKQNNAYKENGELTERAIDAINVYIASQPTDVRARLHRHALKFSTERTIGGRQKIGADGNSVAKPRGAWYHKYLDGAQYTVEHNNAMINVLPEIIGKITKHGTDGAKREWIEFNSTATIVPEYIARERNKTDLKLSDEPTYKKWLGDRINTSDGKLKYVSEPGNSLKAESEKAQESKPLSDAFNKIIQDVKGVEDYKKFSEIVGKRRGAKKNKFDFYVPPSAADFELLLYNFMGKGKEGDAHKEFFNNALLKPYANGVALMDAARQSIKREYKSLLKAFPEISSKLEKLTPDKDFTIDQALRVSIWNGAGVEIPGLSERDTKKLTELVDNDPELSAFKQGLMATSRQENGWTNPSSHWDVDTIISDLYNITEGEGRKQFLGEFIDNASEVFGTWEGGKLVGPNMNKIEAVYGTGVREALEDSLYRMTNGKNKSFGADSETTRWNSWVNGSVGTIMFLNTRSAALQLTSAVNFLNFRDNNPFAAASAFANQKQYWSDFAHIFNSDKLKERRGGLKDDIQAAEIANAARGTQNKAKAVVAYMFKLGYTPTQIADSFAIASGGAPFYRNRIKSYLKEGKTEAEAEALAWQDFSKVSDETQQSGDPKDISKQQASASGRLILAFQNTTMQQSRLVKKSYLDLKNGRGDAKTHISKIVYYLAVQNIIFSSLQSALFAVGFGSDDDDDIRAAKREEDKTKKIISTANSVVDGILRGTGFGGAIVATLKNVAMKYLDEKDKKFKADYAKVVLEAANISPPIGSKLRKMYSGFQQTKYDKDLIAERGWGFTQDGRVHLGPMYNVVGSEVEAFTNLPMARLASKVENISEAMNSENKAWQRVMVGLGWNPYTIGIGDTEGDIDIKAKAKEVRKEEGKEKSKATREETKRKKILDEKERKANLTAEEIVEEKIDSIVNRKIRYLKAKETRKKNKRVKDSINTVKMIDQYLKNK